MSRTAAELVKNFEKEESKNGGEIQLKTAIFLPTAEIRHLARPGDTVAA